MRLLCVVSLTLSLLASCGDFQSDSSPDTSPAILDAVDAAPPLVPAEPVPFEDVDTASADLRAELSAPPQPPACIAVNPAEVDFGSVTVGYDGVVPLEIGACGETPLEIYAIYVEDPAPHPSFEVDLWRMDSVPTSHEPVVVPVGHSATVYVNYVPNIPKVPGDLDTAQLVILSNAGTSPTVIPLVGFAYTCNHPTAVIACEEGHGVIPQTVLHLYGDQSYIDMGAIHTWEWSVEQPAGSQSVFVPSADYPNPSFEANVAGVYTFHLTVWGDDPLPGEASYEVAVIPCEAIHVELLWHTPGDEDETDTGPAVGSDLDLHFLHPNADSGWDGDGDGEPDGWFDTEYDCFWFNAHPAAWGSVDPEVNDDPGLDRDDTDGAGPENINLDLPEDLTYRIGVHYWHAHGFGPAYATVRVYIYSQLVFEVADVLLNEHDLWEVATLTWPSGALEPIVAADGGLKNTPAYLVPQWWEP